MEFNDKKPIYIQLVEQIKIDIITNKYKINEKIPSVREFALNLKVNPNTINRALLQLEEEKLIITKRTSGKFITDDQKLIDKIKNDVAKTTTEKFLNDMEKLNISKKEIIELIKGE